MASCEGRSKRAQTSRFYHGVPAARFVRGGEEVAWYDRAMAWDPFSELRAWTDRLERLAVHHAESWAPAMDVYETLERYVVTAEVPGMTREQVILQLEDSRLTVRGERPHSGGEGGQIVHYHQVERGHGAFQRTFEFDDKIDVERVTADLSAGVLTIILPKRAPQPARKIDVT
jgi:HSP20 family protein